MIPEEGTVAEMLTNKSDAVTQEDESGAVGMELDDLKDKFIL